MCMLMLFSIGDEDPIALLKDPDSVLELDLESAVNDVAKVSLHTPVLGHCLGVLNKTQLLPMVGDHLLTYPGHWRLPIE
jgi:hypothetical protein